jgi:hypothetical protein
VVYFSPIWRYKLRDGSGRLGCPLGSLLGKASVLMREWGNEPNKVPNRWLRLEAVVVTICVLACYATCLHYLLT